MVDQPLLKLCIQEDAILFVMLTPNVKEQIRKDHEGNSSFHTYGRNVLVQTAMTGTPGVTPQS